MKKFIAVSVFVSLCMVVKAQNPSDIMSISTTSNNFSTARSVAMGGAFGALGADASSMNINPAGIGMYRSSDVSATLGFMNRSNVSNSYSLKNGNSSSHTKSEFSVPLNNMSVAFNVYNGNKGLKSLTIAAGYNLAYNHNSKTLASGGNMTTSMLDIFTARLYGVNPDKIYGNNDNYSYNSPYLWGGILAYNTGMLYAGQTDGVYNYALSGYNQQGQPVGTLYNGDLVAPVLELNKKGRTSDYSFSMGANVDDILFLGMTLGYQGYSLDYYRGYSEFADLHYNLGDLDTYTYREQLNTKGSGFSFKLGATFVPVKGLKIGAAVHAPTVYSISETYYAGMTTYYVNESQYYSDETVPNYSDYRVNTPTHFIGSISYTIGKVAILSADYERIAYSKMKVSGLGGSTSLNNEISNLYKSTNNFRVGGEFNILNSLFLRAGYSYMQNSDRYDDANKGFASYSGGIGYRVGNMYVDVAYVNQSIKTPNEYYFYQKFPEGVIKSDDYYNIKSTLNNVILTIGFKF